MYMKFFILRSPAFWLAFFWLNYCHAFAQEVPVDYALAQKAYEQQDYRAAFNHWQILANQNHAPSQFKLATLYDEGQGVEKDITKARYWYGKAAEQGYLPAQFNLGLLEVAEKKLVSAKQVSVKPKEETASYIAVQKPICQNVPDLVLEWAKAWSERNLDVYLQFYAPNYHPVGITRARWLKERTQRIKHSAYDIHVSISALTLNNQGNRKEAIFTQVYDNQIYKDQVEKTLVFDNVGGKCRIVEEKVSKGRLY